MARARNIIFLFFILLGVGDENFVIEISNAKRGILSWKPCIDKPARGYLLEVFVKHVHSALTKIGGIKKVMAIRRAHGEAFVDCSQFTFNSYNGVGLVQSRVPAGNCSIFTDENEKGRGRVSIFRDLEERRTIKHDTRGVSSRVGALGRNRND